MSDWGRRALAPFAALPADLRVLVRRERVVLALLLAVTLLAKAEAFLPGYSIDDYVGSADAPRPARFDRLAAQGRPGQWLFFAGAQALQADPITARILFVCLAIAAYAFFSFAVVRFWGVREGGSMTFLAAAMIANHPYTCEIFTFRRALPAAALVLGLLALLLLLACRPQRHFALGALAFAAALSVYQIVLHFAVMVVLMGAAIAGSRQLQSGGERGPLLDDRNARLALFVFGGGLSYYLAGALFGGGAGMSGGVFAVLPPGEVAGRVLVAAKYVLGTFIAPNVLVPPLPRALFALLTGALLLGLAWRAARVPVGVPRSAALALGVAALLGAAALWSVGVFLFLRSYWPVPRNMAHMGIFWAGCVVLAAATVPRPWAARALAVAAAVILCSFVGVNQHILDEQRRLNTRDLLQAERLVARLERLPGFPAVRRVAFVGGRAWYPLGLQRTQWGDMNISAFAPVWSQVALLREATGYDLQRSRSPRELAAAAAYCAAAPTWPARGSIALRRDVAFVCYAPVSVD